MVAILLFAALAAAQTSTNGATITGTVTDAQNHPVARAKVSLRSHATERMTTTTDSNGRFQFASVEAGKWEIHVQSANLTPVEYELALKPGERTEVEIVQPDRHTIEQQVQVTATWLPEDPNKVPAPIEVFSGEELRDRGVRDMQGAMALATGVEVAPGGDSGPASSVPDFWGLKEFDAFLLLVDGVPWGGAFNPALTALNMSDVERVEVLRGPAAVTYGATSFVGVINVVHQGVESSERSLTLRGGSHGSGGGSFSTPLPLWGQWKSRLTLEGEREGFPDERTSFARGHGLWRIERKWDAERRFWMNADVNWLDQEPASPRSLDEDLHVLTTPVDANYNPAGAFLNDHRATFMLGFDRPVASSHWSTSISVSHANQAAFRGFLAEPDPVADNAHGFRENIQLTDIYADTHFRWRLSQGAMFIVGSDYLHGTGNAQGADFDYTAPLSGVKTVVPQPSDLDFHIGDNRDFLGPYASIEWNPFERVRIDAGVRLNVTHESQDVVDGGAGTSQADARTDVRGGANLGVTVTAWQSGQDDVHLYADYRDTFKPAAIDFGIGESPAGDLILKPETSRSVEGGLKGRFFDRRLELEASGFLMDFNNLVMPADIGGLPGLINAGAQRFKGFETGASFFLPRDLIARASYSFHDARFTDFINEDGDQMAGNRIEMSACNIGSFGLMYAPAKGFLGGVTVNYTGGRFLDEANTAFAEGFATVDLSAGYRWRHYELRVDGRNLGDSRDPVAASEFGEGSVYLMTGRRVDGSLRIRF